MSYFLSVSAQLENRLCEIFKSNRKYDDEQRNQLREEYYIKNQKKKLALLSSILLHWLIAVSALKIINCFMSLNSILDIGGLNF